MFPKSSSLLIIFFTLNINTASSSLPARKLVRNILRDYEPLVRPVVHENEHLTITLGLELLQLLEVNEKSQTLKLAAFFRQQWTDVNLGWNSTEYANITVIRLPISKIWHPDIYLYNNADADSSGSIAPPGSLLNAFISDSGFVHFVPKLIVTSSCRMDVTWFPFDMQTCVLTIASWTYSAVLLDAQLGPVDMEQYIENGKWAVLDFKGARVSKVYPSDPVPYVSIEFTLVIKRRVLYYFFNLIVPCGLIGFLALLGFTIPPDSGEKLTLGVTVLFSLIVFLNMIGETMPANSDSIPLLGTYFNCVMFMIASSMVSTVLYNKCLRSIVPPKPFAGIIKKIILIWLPRILWFDVPSFGSEAFELPLWKRSCRLPQPEETDGTNNLGMIWKHKEQQVVQVEWKFAALVLDRLCLVISLAFALISILLFLVSSL